MKQDLYVVKIGGNVLDNPDQLAEFLQLVAAQKQPMVLVHGGGKIATQIGQRMGIEARYHEGRRITDAPTLDLVTMVYAGLVNKQLVAQLQAVGVNALGLTGADANALPAVKRPVKDIDYGWVGDVRQNDIPADFWQDLIHRGILPVMAPITHDGQGHLLNTNADTIASALAVALSPFFATTLVYCFEKKGVLLDVNDDSSVVPLLNTARYEELKSTGRLFAGMIPKLHNCFTALQQGVNKVIIGQARDLEAHLSGHSTGTTIVL